jgi:prepilin-type N-terminal cleavage/methylation domain-containing protein
VTSLTQKTVAAPRRARQRGITMIELLAAMAVAGILTVMMLSSWFALSDSYSFTVRSDKARDKARQAISRLEREIRDAENRADVTEVSVVRARPWFIVIYTTFNKDGNESASTRPRLVMYRLYSDGELWRFHDENNNGVIGGVETSSEPWPALTFNVAEQINGEGGQLLTDSVVNMRVPSASSPTPLFQYSYYATDGTTVLANMVLGTNNRYKIKSVEINLLVDTNPEHSPVYTNLQTTAQLRNQR